MILKAMGYKLFLNDIDIILLRNMTYVFNYLK